MVEGGFLFWIGNNVFRQVKPTKKNFLCPSLSLVLFHILNTFIHYLTFCFYHPPNIFKLQIREPTVFPNSFCLVTQSVLSDFKESTFLPFLHYSLPVSSNWIIIIVKRLTSKETFQAILSTFLDQFVLTVVGWRPGPCCRTREHLPSKEPSLQIQRYLSRYFRNFDLTFHS